MQHTNDWLPWERQDDESLAAWTAFVVYRDHGPYRSFARVAEAGHSDAAVARWSHQHDWLARVRAYDSHIDRVRRETFLELQRQTITAHQEAGRTLREKAMLALAQVPLHILVGQPRVALAMLDTAVKMESGSLGLPTEVTSLRVTDGQVSDPRDAYFERMDPAKLLDLGRLAVAELEKKQPVKEAQNG